jgi:hypothetical protein
MGHLLLEIRSFHFSLHIIRWNRSGAYLSRGTTFTGHRYISIFKLVKFFAYSISFKYPILIQGGTFLIAIMIKRIFNGTSFAKRDNFGGKSRAIFPKFHHHKCFFKLSHFVENKPKLLQNVPFVCIFRDF